MEENGRVTVKKVERPDGMTEYLLEYIPPIMISEGNYLKEEHLNLAVYTKPCNDIERHFNETVEVKKAVRFDIACGLRRADLLALRWENLESEKRRYYMCITIKKTGNKVRIPLSKEAVSILRPIRKKGAVFPTLSPYILNHKVPLLIEAAGIDKHITFHCFRHTFAMQLLDKGVDIPTIAFFLGHKFLGSSLTYLHCTKEHLEEVIAKLER